MSSHMVPVYAALLSLVFAALSVRVLRMRRRLGISVGDAGNEAMLRAMRAHSNFAEYVPISLLLFHFVEIGGAQTVFVHLLCGSLLLGRLLHAIGVSQLKEDFRFRVAGMACTLTPLVAAALRLLWVGAGGGGA